MVISTETGSLERYGDIHEILKLIKGAGFEAYDFTMMNKNHPNSFIGFDDYIEKAKELKKFADDLGIICNQTHSFFPSIRPNDEEWNELGMKLTIRSLEVTAILGAPYCIVHPVNDYKAEENKNFYESLIPYAKKLGVKIALENMWNWDNELGHAVSAACSSHDDFNHHLDLLPQEFFGACLDIGHAEMKGLGTSAVKMIHALNKRLTCLHLHDNDRHHDNHRLPYTYGIDFEPIIDALAFIDYRGDITFEADCYPYGFPLALYPAALKLMAEVGNYIRTEINRRKK